MALLLGFLGNFIIHIKAKNYVVSSHACCWRSAINFICSRREVTVSLLSAQFMHYGDRLHSTPLSRELSTLTYIYNIVPDLQFQRPDVVRSLIPRKQFISETVDHTFLNYGTSYYICIIFRLSSSSTSSSKQVLCPVICYDLMKEEFSFHSFLGHPRDLFPWGW